MLLWFIAVIAFSFCMRASVLLCVQCNIVKNMAPRRTKMLTKRKNKICRSQNKHNDDYFNEIDKIGDERWEMDDPSPDIEWLYRGFNKHLFNGALPTDIKVKWSQELGTTAGQYLWFKKIIELNESLLKYRSRRNMVEILLVINTFSSTIDLTHQLTIFIHSTKWFMCTCATTRHIQIISKW